MSQFRLNAKKPKNNAGLPTPKTELYLLYVEDIISMPEVDAKGILSTSDIVIAPSRRFHILYQTPSSQVHSREIEGDADSRGFKKKLTGSFPGDDLEINEFIKNNLNQGFVILVKSCHSDLKKIYGSKCNPLYFTGSFTDDNNHKGYELTFEQEFADDTPVIFYKGNVLVDEDALGSTVIVRNLPRNIATIDYTDDDGEKQEGNTYTKEQINNQLDNKMDNPIRMETSNMSIVSIRCLFEYYFILKADDYVDNYAIRVIDLLKLVFKVFMSFNNAIGDHTYTKQVVAKGDGTLGLVDRVETLSQEKLVDVQFQTMPMFTEENSVSNSDELALTISETSIIPTGTIIEAKIILPNYKGYITAMRVTKEPFSIRIPKKFESLFSPYGATTQGKLYLRFIN